MEPSPVGAEGSDETSDLGSKVGSLVGFLLGGTGSEVGSMEGIFLIPSRVPHGFLGEGSPSLLLEPFGLIGGSITFSSFLGFLTSMSATTAW